MPEKNHFEMISSYSACLHDDCACQSTCLRHRAYKELLQTNEVIRIVNPTKCTKDTSCPFYRDDKPVRFARGFTNFQEKMFPDQYRTFRARCIAHFGRNGYFMRRRGELALSPAEQQLVRKALQKAGITEEWPFDAYDEQQNWKD